MGAGAEGSGRPEPIPTIDAGLEAIGTGGVPCPFEIAVMGDGAEGNGLELVLARITSSPAPTFCISGSFTSIPHCLAQSTASCLARSCIPYSSVPGEAVKGAENPC